MSRKIYDYVKCYELAQQCTSSSEMQKLNGSAYNVARKYGWIKEYTWFERKQHTPYTYEEVYEIAKNYTCSVDFQKGNGSAYGKARENGWINDYYWFTIKHRKPYTRKECYEIAEGFRSRTEFARGNTGAYQAALNHGWIEDYTWFESKQNPFNYWTKERVAEESKKYKNRGDFHDNCGTAYGKARRNGWLDEFTWLKDDRIDFSSDKIDCVYAYEFKEFNSVYVGRTLKRRVQNRDYEHLFTDTDAVALFIKEHDIAIPPMIILESDLTLKEGIEKEGYYLERYKESGWKILNRAKTGSVGLLFKNKWTKDSCYHEAQKYTTRGDFAKLSPRAYEVARSKGWLDSYEWFEELQEPNGYWDNYDNCYNAALLCKNKTEFSNRFNRACVIAKKNGWIKDYTWINKKRQAHNKKWDYNTTFEEAQKYKSRSEFKREANGAYHVARVNGWLDLYVWFEPTAIVHSRAVKAAKRRKWTYETCKELASHSKGRLDFRKQSPGAYNAAWTSGWLNDYFK